MQQWQSAQRLESCWLQTFQKTLVEKKTFTLWIKKYRGKRRRILFVIRASWSGYSGRRAWTLRELKRHDPRRGLLIYKSPSAIIQFPSSFWIEILQQTLTNSSIEGMFQRLRWEVEVWKPTPPSASPYQCLPYWRVTKPVFELKLRYIDAPHRSAYEILRCVL